jgi:hypothetical protein
MTLLGCDVLVCGGHNGSFQSSCVQYIASINAWSTTTIPPLPVAIGYFPMITLRGRPYVFGGYNGNIFNTVYTFDTSNVWSARTPMELALWGHTAVALDTNTALVCGGCNASNVDQSACFSYAAASDTWSAAAQLNTARDSHGMAVYKGVRIALFVRIILFGNTGRVLVYGGYGNEVLATVEMLSIDGQTWATLPTPMFKADYLFASVALP